jgi:hypothetical protein
MGQFEDSPVGSSNNIDGGPVMGGGYPGIRTTFNHVPRAQGTTRL